MKQTFNIFTSHHATRGGALIIMMVIGILLSIFSLTSFDQFNNAIDMQEVSKRTGDEKDLSEEVRLILGDKHHCSISFSDPTNPQKFYKVDHDEGNAGEGIPVELWGSNQDGNARTSRLFAAGDAYGDITINTIRLVMNNFINSTASIGSNYSASSNNSDIGELQINFSKHQAANINATKILKFDVKVNMETNAAGESTIKSCQLFNRTIDYFQVCASANMFFSINTHPYCQASLNGTLATSRNYLPYTGGHAGSYYSDQCPAGSAAIGLKIWSGRHIDAVQMLCKKINYTSLTSYGPQISPPLPKRGSGGSSWLSMCPEGLFVTGLHKKAGIAWVPMPRKVLKKLKVTCSRYIVNDGSTIANANYAFMGSTSAGLIAKCQEQIDFASGDYKVALKKLCRKHLAPSTTLTFSPEVIGGGNPNIPLEDLSELSCSEYKNEINNIIQATPLGAGSSMQDYLNAKQIINAPVGVYTVAEVSTAQATVTNYVTEYINIDEITQDYLLDCPATPLPLPIGTQPGDKCKSGTVLREIHLNNKTFISGLGATCW